MESKRKVKKSNFNTKAKKVLDEMGYYTEIVETYNFFSKTKKDIFNFMDAISLNPDVEKEKILAIQICARASIATRYNKITKDTIIDSKTKEVVKNTIPEKAKTWLLSGGGIWILGFESQSLKDRIVKIRKITLDKNNNFLYTDERIN